MSLWEKTTPNPTRIKTSLQLKFKVIGILKLTVIHSYFLSSISTPDPTRNLEAFFVNYKYSSKFDVTSPTFIVIRANLAELSANVN